MIIQGKITEKALENAPVQLPFNLGIPGQGIPFATVKLVGKPPLQDKVDSTDGDGNFKLEVPQGTYVFQARSPVHFPHSETVNRDKTINIALQRSAF